MLTMGSFPAALIRQKPACKLLKKVTFPPDFFQKLEKTHIKVWDASVAEASRFVWPFVRAEAA